MLVGRCFIFVVVDREERKNVLLTVSKYSTVVLLQWCSTPVKCFGKLKRTLYRWKKLYKPFLPFKLPLRIWKKVSDLVLSFLCGKKKVLTVKSEVEVFNRKINNSRYVILDFSESKNIFGVNLYMCCLIL